MLESTYLLSNYRLSSVFCVMTSHMCQFHEKPCSALKTNTDAFLILTSIFNPYLIEAPFDAFANRADPDQAALIRAA